MSDAKNIVDELEDDFKVVEETLEVSITYHDLIGVFRKADGFPLLSSSRTTHTLPICAFAHTRRCLNDCQREVNTTAAENPNSFQNNCWKGVLEIVTPIHKDGTHVGTIFAGCFRSKKKPDSDIPAKTRAKIAKMRKELPPLHPSTENRVSRISRLLAKAVLRRIDEIKELQRYSDNRKQAIAKYVETRIQHNITLREVAEHIHLSESRTCHLVKELFGETLKSLVLKERLTRAKHLLVNSDLTLSEIADRVGVSDIHYFTKLFKKAVGTPPGAYRRTRTGNR